VSRDGHAHEGTAKAKEEFDVTSLDKLQKK
jgi:hypothetical protein